MEVFGPSRRASLLVFGSMKVRQKIRERLARSCILIPIGSCVRTLVPHLYLWRDYARIVGRCAEGNSAGTLGLVASPADPQFGSALYGVSPGSLCTCPMELLGATLLCVPPPEPRHA